MQDGGIVLQVIFCEPTYTFSAGKKRLKRVAPIVDRVTE